MKSLVVVCPVYEEAATIFQFHVALRLELEKLGGKYACKVLYVCDPGRDDTAVRLKQLAVGDPSVGALILSRRFGHQAALLAGIDRSVADVIVMMDCDMQHPPRVIPMLLAEYEGGADVVHTMRTYGRDVSLLRRVASDAYYEALQSLSETRIYKNSADFRLISGRVAALFRSSIRERNQFMRGLFAWVGFKQIAIEFDAPARAGGRTKYTLSRIVRFATAGIVSFSKKPLRYAIYAGTSIAFVGLLLVTTTVVQWIAGANFPSGWATLVSLMSFLGGVQLIFLGIIGEYIASIFDEVKARPHYIIDYEL